MREYELIIVGAGPAGISAASAASRRGITRIAVIDRLPEAGGMLTQCFHRGFGRSRYGKELTGPEFISRIMQDEETAAELLVGTFVSEINPKREITTVSQQHGVMKLRSEAVILSTGCRERAIGALPVYGNRPAGVFTAGSVQRMINLSNSRIGRHAVVLGSGDVGMIVAHHLAETGTQVIAVIEKQDRIGGLARNRARYLDEYDIPVITCTTVVRLHGTARLEGVTICDVDRNGNPAPDTGRRIACDTLITSVGLIPELELVRNLSPLPPWIFICGNANRVHGLVDSVVAEGEQAGRLAADYISRTISCTDSEVPRFR